MNHGQIAGSFHVGNVVKVTYSADYPLRKAFETTPFAEIIEIEGDAVTFGTTSDCSWIVENQFIANLEIVQTETTVVALNNGYKPSPVEK
jgi:hypothetical protein